MVLIMTLPTNCCEWTVLVELIVEDVVTCFFCWDTMYNKKVKNFGYVYYM